MANRRGDRVEAGDRTETADETADERAAVFVSYSRRDAEFVVESVKPQLASLDLDVWIDLDDIPPSSKWRDEIQDGIERCEALIIIVSPDSAMSPEVGKELVRADELGKRIVPVLHREVEPNETHPAIRDRNWVHWRTDDESAAALARIDESLKVDPEWTKEHNRLNGLALVWARRDRDRSLLVSGSALNSDEAALAVERPPEQPQATALMREFIAESRRNATRRQRRLVITSLTVAVVSISLAIVAVFARFEAERQRSEAVRQRDAATSTALASQSENRLATEPDLSALLALEAYRTADTVDALGSLLRVNDTSTTFIDRYSTHSAQISVVTVNEPSATAATGDRSGAVVLWDVAADGTAAPRSATIDLPAAATALAFDETGEHLTVAYDNGGDLGGIEVWQVPADATADALLVDDVPTPIEVSVLSVDGTLGAGLILFDDDTHGMAIVSVADGEIIATGSLDVWPDDFEQLDPTSVVFSPDSSQVAFGLGSEMFVWSWMESDDPEVIEIEELGIPNLERVSLALTSVTFVGDGDRMAFGIDEGDIFLTDITAPPGTAEAVAAQPASTSEALALRSITTTDVGGSPETVLASAHNNGQVKVWFVDGLTAFEAATLRGHDEEVHAVALTSSGAVVSGSWDGDVIWSSVFARPKIGEQIVDPDTLTSHDADVLAVEFIGTEGVASLGRDGILKSWDPATGSGTDDLDFESVSSMAAAGGVVAIGDEAGVVALIDSSGEISFEFDPAHDDWVTLVAVSEDEASVVSADDAGAVWLWNIGSGSRTLVETPEGFEPYAFAFPTADTLWIGGAVALEETESMAIRIDTSTGQVIERARHNDDEAGHLVTSIALSPDGSTLATGGSDRRIFLFDTADVSVERAELATHLEEVSDIVFFDDEVMFAGDRDGGILMWDVDAERPVGELTGPTDGIYSLALSPDGTSLVAGGEDDRVWIWDLQVDSWIANACDLAGRNLTESEWARFNLRGDPVNHCPGLAVDDRPVAVYPDAGQ